ncbi:MAG: hypothetical protein ACJARD_001053 [Alphaproteobacteria bacterium]|jgi:hypothetical protein
MTSELKISRLEFKEKLQERIKVGQTIKSELSQGTDFKKIEDDFQFWND